MMYCKNVSASADARKKATHITFFIFVVRWDGNLTQPGKDEPQDQQLYVLCKPRGCLCHLPKSGLVLDEKFLMEKPEATLADLEIESRSPCSAVALAITKSTENYRVIKVSYNLQRVPVTYLNKSIMRLTRQFKVNPSISIIFSLPK